MRPDDAADRHPALGQLLEDQRHGGGVHPEAAKLLRHRYPKQAQLLHLLDQLGGVDVLVVVLTRDRYHIAPYELPNEAEDLVFYLR